MSQQVTKEKYSIETLRERNVSYDHQHWLTQKDVDMANNYVELIERTRSEITPQIGDRLVYVTEHGDYYGNALIDSRSAKEGYLSVCEQPYVPFVWEEDGNIRLSVSGGAFHSVNPEELKFLKWTEGVFKGNWDNQIVLWCFRREYVFLPSAEWETFNAPIETRRLNFHPEQVKIVKDMEKHITYFYRIKPDNF